MVRNFGKREVRHVPNAGDVAPAGLPKSVHSPLIELRSPRKGFLAVGRGESGNSLSLRSKAIIAM